LLFKKVKKEEGEVSIFKKWEVHLSRKEEFVFS